MSDTGAIAADNGPLSVDQAVALLEDHGDQPVAAETPPADGAEDAAAAESAENTEADTTAEEDGSEAEQPGDAEDTEGEEAAGTLKLTPPNWWNKEQKAKFEALPPDLQAVVYQQEENRENALQKAKAKAAEAEKVHTEAAAKSAERLKVLEQFLPQAMEMYGNRWANVDWAAAAEQLDPAAYNKARAQYESETNALHQLVQQKQQAESDRYANFLREQGQMLHEVAPDLADEKLGPARRQELSTFLTKQGVKPEELRWMTANQAAIAYDAMRFRAAKANARANPVPNTPVPQRVVAKPTATPQVRSPQSARLNELSRKPRLSREEAVELMTLRET